MLPGRTAGGEAAAAKRQLAPRLQADIQAALAEYQPDAVADYLQARCLTNPFTDLCLLCAARDPPATAPSLPSLPPRLPALLWRLMR